MNTKTEIRQNFLGIFQRILRVELVFGKFYVQSINYLFPRVTQIDVRGKGSNRNCELRRSHCLLYHQQEGELGVKGLNSGDFADFPIYNV
jgi:hypothetical protein